MRFVRFGLYILKLVLKHLNVPEEHKWNGKIIQMRSAKKRKYEGYEIGHRMTDNDRYIHNVIIATHTFQLNNWTIKM